MQNMHVLVTGQFAREIDAAIRSDIRMAPRNRTRLSILIVHPDPERVRQMAHRTRIDLVVTDAASEQIDQFHGENNSRLVVPDSAHVELIADRILEAAQNWPKRES